jgi:hypothetical protein
MIFIMERYLTWGSKLTTLSGKKERTCQLSGNFTKSAKDISLILCIAGIV